MYDAHTEGYGEASELLDAFMWRNLYVCWDPIRKGLCIYRNTDDRDLITDYIESESCIPSDMSGNWNLKSKILCGSNDDPNYSMKHNSLDKSLANRCFTHCTAFCVYDFGTIMSNCCT